MQVILIFFPFYFLYAGALTPISQAVFKGYGSEILSHTFISMYYTAGCQFGREDKHA